MQHVGGRCDHENLCRCLENYINQRRFNLGRRKRKDWLKTTTRHHIALDSDLRPDCVGLRHRENPEMYDICESRKAMMNLDVSMPWDSSVQDSQKKRSEEKLRWFNALTWPSTNLVKEESEEETVSQKNCNITPMCVHLSRLQLFLTLTWPYILRKKKRIKLYFYMSASFFSSAMQQYQLLWVIKCQSHLCRRTFVILFNPWLKGQECYYLSKRELIQKKIVKMEFKATI